MSDLTLISIVWAIAVVLYYFCGKDIGYSRGYAKGFEAGVKLGHANVLQAINTQSNFIQDTKQ